MTPDKLAVTKWWWLMVIICACAAGPSGHEAGMGRRSVAVPAFEDLSPLNEAAEDVSDLLTAKAIEAIQDRGDYDVVERQRLASVLEELNIGTSQMADRENQLKLGAITGAGLMVFGTFQIIENQLRLDVRLVDVESGQVLNAVSAMAAENNLHGWLDTAAKATAELFQ